MFKVFVNHGSFNALKYFDNIVTNKIKKSNLM